MIISPIQLLFYVHRPYRSSASLLFNLAERYCDCKCLNKSTTDIMLFWHILNITLLCHYTAEKALASQVDELARDVSVLCDIRHPNIATVMAACRADDNANHPFLMYHFMDGLNLKLFLLDTTQHHVVRCGTPTDLNCNFDFNFLFLFNYHYYNQR